MCKDTTQVLIKQKEITDRVYAERLSLFLLCVIFAGEKLKHLAKDS